MNEMTSLTVEAILAESSRLLRDAEYQVVRDQQIDGLRPERLLLAEDRYAVVMLDVFDTWTELEQMWAEAEARYSDLIAVSARPRPGIG